MLSESEPSDVRLLSRLWKLLPWEWKLPLWSEPVWKLLELLDDRRLFRLRPATSAGLWPANDALRFLLSSALRLPGLSRPKEVDECSLAMFGSEPWRVVRRPRRAWSRSNFSRLVADSPRSSSVVPSSAVSSSVVVPSVSSLFFFFFFFFLSFFFFFFLDFLSRRDCFSSSSPTARVAFIPSASWSNSSRLPFVDSSLSVVDPSDRLPDLFFLRFFFFLSFLFLGFSSSSSASLPSSMSLRLLTLISTPGTANDFPFFLQQAKTHPPQQQRRRRGMMTPTMAPTGTGLADLTLAVPTLRPLKAESTMGRSV